jgi:hypothetical protein
MVDFCSSDDRLLPVGYLPLISPERALVTAKEAVALSARALWVPSDAPGDISPAHTDFDPIWSVMQDLVFEDVEWLIDSAGPELFLFSTDYPHPEGGRDPFGKFEASLGKTGVEERKLFYAENFLHLMQIEVA